jgi:hypothetical protein
VSVRAPAVAEGRDAGPLHSNRPGDLRRLVRGARRRPPRIGEAAPLLARLLQSARTVDISHAPAGMAFRFEVRGVGAGQQIVCSPCVISDAADDSPLDSLRSARLRSGLCEGRTLAQNRASARRHHQHGQVPGAGRSFASSTSRPAWPWVRRLCPYYGSFLKNTHHERATGPAFLEGPAHSGSGCRGVDVAVPLGMVSSAVMP